MEIKKEVSSTLMVANLIAIVLVIAAHYSSKGSIDTSKGYTWNYLFQDFMWNGVAQSTVPFFAMVAGFFLTGKVNNFQNYFKALKIKSRTLLLPYILASTLIFLPTVLKYILLQKNIVQFSFHSILMCVVLHPISVQFWFIRDLIIIVVISPLILNGGKLYFGAIGVMLSFLWICDIQPFPIFAGWYLINMGVLFFFWLGGLLSRFSNILDSLVKSNVMVKITLLIIWLLIIFIRVYIDPEFDFWYVRNYTIGSLLLYKTALFMGVVSLIQISSLIKNNKTIISLSGFTFFVYLYHLVPLLNFTILTARFIDDRSSFYINFPIATIIVFSIAWFISRYFSNLYSLLTGGRTPNKTIKRIE